MLSIKPYWQVLIALWVLVFGLGAYSLFDDNEGLYASIASVMHRGGSLVIPSTNGVPYIEKPPLFYWLDATLFYILGENEWAARLPSVLSTLAIGYIITRFLKTQQAEAQQCTLATMVWFTSIGILFFGRIAFMEMALVLFTTSALLAFYLWDQTGNLKWLVACHACVACATLTKGIVGIGFVGAVIMTYMLIERRSSRQILKLLHPAAVSVFLLIAVPWHVMAIQHDSGFAWFYLINENLLRIVGMRVPKDYYRGSIWYYAVRFPLYLLPWAYWIPQLVIWCKGAWKEHRLYRLLILWFSVLFVTFSLSANKGNYYMLVGVPPVVILLSYYLNRGLNDGATKIRYFTYGAIALAICLTPAESLYLHFSDARFSQRLIAEALKAETAPVKVFILNDFEELSSLAFYWKKPIAIVESQSSDLQYGRPYRPDLFITHNDLVNMPNKQDVRLIVRNLPRLEKVLVEGSGGDHWRKIYSTQKASIWRWYP